MPQIVIKELINNDIAVSTDDGNIVFEKLNAHLLNDEKVVLDFEGIIIMTTAFLNVAIGKLYSNADFNSEFLNKNIQFINVAKDDFILFKKVVERAKEYFGNKEGFENILNEPSGDE
jgi:hypothetical protein